MKGQPQLLKSLGQHFLVNSHICEKIVSLASPEKKDRIIEIGPGAGALSLLIDQCSTENYLLLEKDWRWAKRLSPMLKNGQLILIDSLHFDWRKLKDEWKIIGNLPYNIASPLIWDILSRTSALRQAIFMVQLEVAERITAKPGSRNYGALSVWCQCHANVKLEFKVSPGSFKPPPKIHSAVVSFLPLDADQKDFSGEKLNFLLRLFFQKRRKQLGSILKNSPYSSICKHLPALGISLQARPEDITPRQFISLSHYHQTG